MDFQAEPGRKQAAGIPGRQKHGVLGKPAEPTIRRPQAGFARTWILDLVSITLRGGWAGHGSKGHFPQVQHSGQVPLTDRALK